MTTARQDADARGVRTSERDSGRLDVLSELVGGYDFASVIDAYWRGHERGEESLKASDPLAPGRIHDQDRREERPGRADLHRRQNVYDHLSSSPASSGSPAILAVGCLDEMVNLYKLPSTQARKSNYEQILRIVNDASRAALSIGFLLGGTPEFLMDPRRGSTATRPSRAGSPRTVRDRGNRRPKGPVLGSRISPRRTSTSCSPTPPRSGARRPRLLPAPR